MKNPVKNLFFYMLLLVPLVAEADRATAVFVILCGSCQSDSTNQDRLAREQAILSAKSWMKNAHIPIDKMKMEIDEDAKYWKIKFSTLPTVPEGEMEHDELFLVNKISGKIDKIFRGQ